MITRILRKLVSTAFDQDLSNWNLTGARSVDDMFRNSGMTNVAFYPVGCTCAFSCRDECLDTDICGNVGANDSFPDRATLDIALLLCMRIETAWGEGEEGRMMYGPNIGEWNVELVPDFFDLFSDLN
jgi:hypothetical protein